MVKMAVNICFGFTVFLSYTHRARNILLMLERNYKASQAILMCSLHEVHKMKAAPWEIVSVHPHISSPKLLDGL